MAHRNFRHTGLRQTTIARPDTLRTLRPFFPLRVDGTPDTNYRDFHLALHRLYGLSTDGALHRLNIELSDNIFSIVSAAFKKAVEHIHKQGKYSPEMLSDKNVSELINATSSVLSEKLDDLSVKQEIPDDLAATLRKNIFYFSGFKTHHELEEASRMLQSDDGGFKPFSKFYEDVKAIDATYNRNYLQAEYNFATSSTQMAVKWKEWERTADRYDLQYRTAGDDRVREEHRELEGITLPMTDPFWNEYFPPNGWNCRCTAVRVRKGKYPTSDSDEAIQKGKNCTSTPKQQIFRFNPGKQERIFPEKHPYYKGFEMPDCKKCTRNLSLPNKNNPKCAICNIAQKTNDVSEELSKLRNLKGKDYNKQLQTIAEMNMFKPHPKIKNVFWTGESNDADLKNLLDGAKKIADAKTRVYIMPNPGSSRTADYIVVRDNIFKDYDLKTITGKNSVGNRLFDSIGQSRRVVLNMNTDYNPRTLAKDIKKYFEINTDASEVLICKGTRKISIQRSFVENNHFENEFRKIYYKQK